MVIERANEVLLSLESYKGCGESIKKAINNWSDTTLQRQGYDAVSPNIRLVAGFHDIANNIGSFYCKILFFVDGCQVRPSWQCLLV